MLDRYLALARDASSAGDAIAAESYFQFAEHYYRIIGGDGYGDRGANRPRPAPTDDTPVAGDEAAEAVAPVPSDEAEPANF